jgi:hypothetical protein
MVTDADVETRLRSALHAHAPVDGLPEQVLGDSLAAGRTSLRVRRRRALGGSVAALAVVAGLAAAVVQRDDTVPQPAVPSPSPTPSPTPSEETETIATGAWVGGLPVGDPPEVPYLAGTTVVLPDGSRVQTGGNAGAGVIGLTVAGLVLLVESETEQPYSFSSRYVLVTNAGRLRELPFSTLTADGAQEALISPDGTQFTSGGDIVDIRDLSVVGRVPDEADILDWWTPTGIIYGAGRYTYLWPVGGEPRRLPDFPGQFPNGTDIGLDGCEVVRLDATGATTPISQCLVDGQRRSSFLRSVSPSGRWALSRDLGLVDTVTGETRYLAGAPVDPSPYAFDKVWWDGDSHLLLPIFGRLVRCDTATASCELATTQAVNDLALP